eukprot:COSAG02_NODE_52080_length_310_cov_0.725118_1_plen_44_part_10
MVDHHKTRNTRMHCRIRMLVSQTHTTATSVTSRKLGVATIRDLN